MSWSNGSGRGSGQGIEPKVEIVALSCTIIGGPNGSGKSRIYEVLRPDREFVNADLVARALDAQAPESVSLPAGRRVLRRLAELIDARQSFVFKTTLSSHQSVDLMRRARSAGYQVGLVFVVLTSVDLTIKRVAERVSRGGHDIPEAIICRRYRTAFIKLASAIRSAHECVVYDNSGLQPVLLLVLRNSRIVASALDRNNALHVRIADAITSARGFEVGDPFVSMR